MSDHFYSLGILLRRAAWQTLISWDAVLDILDVLADEENQ
jgi:hypothetical protein